MKLISIILPTYNEAENIIDLIKDIKKTLKGYPIEIIVVDDNSPDGTSNQVKKFKSKNINVKLITRYKNRGLTNSIAEGIRNSNGDVVVWMDCDFSHPPKIIVKLLKEIDNGSDIAVASRFVKGGGFKGIKDENPLAIFLSRIMNYFIQILLGGGFKDYTSGFIAIRRICLNKIKLRGDYGEYFIDLMYKANKLNYKFIEIPFLNMPRKSGYSKTGKNMFDYLLKGRKYISITILLLFEHHIQKKF